MFRGAFHGAGGRLEVDGMGSLRLKESELKSTVGSDPRKVAIAHAVHQKTTAARK